MKSTARWLLGFTLFIVLTGISGWLTLWIITSGGDVSIPNVVGEDLKDAIGLLQSRQLYLVLDGEEFHAEAPRGAIIAQNPEAGDVRKAFSTVRVMLSAGPERLEMPDLRGYGLRQARLEMTHFNVDTIHEHVIHHTEYAEGEVIAHSPGPGELVVPDAAVSMIVSKGKERPRYRMPDVIGLTIDESRGLLEEFQSQFDITVSDRREFGPGIVIGQVPESGEPLQFGDPIHLTITAEERDVAGTPSLFTWRVPTGFLNKSLLITYTVDNETEVLMEREVAPSEEVMLYVPNTGRGVLEITLDGELVLSKIR